MYICKIKIKGYKSFGNEIVEINCINKLTAFIGLNSSGKTAALEALRKIFGSSNAEREIFREDFHIANGENIDEITERELFVEVKINFSEEEKEAIPHFFNNMVVEEDGDPYLRIRLEATWAKSNIVPDGEIDSKLYYITVSESEVEGGDAKQFFPKHLRSLIQILYVPAIRKPSDQIKYASGSILFRVLKHINWGDGFKTQFESHISEINALFKGLPEFATIDSSLKEYWRKFHKDERYKDTDLIFGGSDFDSVLKKIEVAFSPTGLHRTFKVNDLGDGYRSLFYLTLVCSLLDIEERMDAGNEEVGINRPLLTILAIEEPENHIAPQLLGRVIKILSNIAEKDNSQVLLSSHTPAIIKRLSPESICHFRITEKYTTEVNNIPLPDKTDEAYKFIKEAVKNYPEIYFAKLVVIGEGDSEEVIFNKFMEILDINFDDNIITFAPLGHRFVNHIWKLLSALHIPYVTLLDLDLERDGGGWGRIKYALGQQIEIGVSKIELLKTTSGLLSDKEFEKMHKWGTTNEQELKNLLSWVPFLEAYGVYFSQPLDLDFLMLSHYESFYKAAIPKGGGPRIPDEILENEKYQEKITSAVHATLKSEEATAATYSDRDKELMIWYNYHFLGRGKPTTHMQVLASMKKKEIKSNVPPVINSIFERIAEILNKDNSDESN